MNIFNKYNTNGRIIRTLITGDVEKIRGLIEYISCDIPIYTKDSSVINSLLTSENTTFGIEFIRTKYGEIESGNILTNEDILKDVFLHVGKYTMDDWREELIVVFDDTSPESIMKYLNSYVYYIACN